MKNNVEIVLRERGKVVERRESHNMWTCAGKTWLTQLVSIAAYGPEVYPENNRLRYMGFGIGGNRQSSSAATSPPLSTFYSGTNLQNNQYDVVTRLERPIYFNDAQDYYKEFDLVEMVSEYHARMTVHVSAAELNYFGTFLSMPVSEVALFHGGIDIQMPAEVPLAYDVFDSISKSTLQDMTVYWTIRL